MWRRSNLGKTLALPLALMLALMLAGCDLPYYWQAIHGHWDLMQRRQPIQDLLQDQQTPAATRQQLQYLLRVREFALQQLPLENNGSYMDYVILDRPYVTWNVFATPELSMTNHTWCYPIAGCVSYRGYFEEAAAREYAQRWRNKGFDTYVGGAGAYSTLGWFDDPVLSSFLQRGPMSLASLLFHELSHQVLYVPDDTLFNESFASAMEQILLQRWVEQADLQAEYESYALQQQRQAEFTAFVLRHKDLRQALFDSELPAAEQRRRKQQLINAMRADYEQLKRQWKGYSGYDRWMAGELNNAQLSTVATYNELEPGFAAMYRQNGNDLGRFLDQCRQLAGLDRDQRHHRLKQFTSPQMDYTQN
ncbi:MAG: aminopeptidase [Pseudomonadota bacterium]|nr:aminopeptidase [Pseudomonadales bacterium]MDY6921678.1 aminopeptidase [Pseudomonadota bacterium]